MRRQEIQEKMLGLAHPSVAITLSNRAGLSESQVRAFRYMVWAVISRD